MGVRAVEAIRNMLRREDIASTPGNCETALDLMITAARAADPQVTLERLIHPGEGHHVALLVNGIVCNPSPAVGYPEYFGPINKAHPTFQHMRREPIE